MHPEGIFPDAPVRGAVGTTRSAGSATAELAVDIDGLVKEYSTRRGDTALRAVDGLTLRIPEGAFFGLLGPNGAGKSTTIRVLTGLSRRTSGHVRVRGMDVNERFREVRRLIGLAPQEFDFDQFLTTEQVLFYHGLYFEMERREARRRAKELLERFGLAHKSDQRVIRLSGGQKRRLLIAKAIMHRPQILILDEPTAGIDVSLRRDLWGYLREQNKQGRTILLTTHYIEEAEALCDTVGIIDRGRLVAQGSPQDLSEASGSDVVVVRLAAPLAMPAERIADGLGLRIAVLEQGMAIEATGGRGGRIATQLLEQLVAAGQPVESLEIRRRDLEDAFVRLTGLRMDESGEAAAREARGGNV
jgi:ABC-2 type transport system ATP-binding protein